MGDSSSPEAPRLCLSFCRRAARLLVRRRPWYTRLVRTWMLAWMLALLAILATETPTGAAGGGYLEEWCEDASGRMYERRTLPDLSAAMQPRDACLPPGVWAAIRRGAGCECAGDAAGGPGSPGVQCACHGGAP